jgi:AcrR family transcriptional regulator
MDFSASVPKVIPMNRHPVSKVRSKPARSAGSQRTSYRHGNLREALVEEAVKMMEERDDSAFTLREVAQRIHVSHTAAYRHFPSKGALLAEIAQRGFRLLTEALSQSLEAGRSAEDIVRLQGRAYVRTALKYPSHFRCMFGPKQFSEDEARAVEEACDQAFECLTKASTKLLRADFDTPAGQDATLAMWSLVHGLAHLALDEQLCEMAGNGTIERYEEMADNVIRVLLGGLNRQRAK